MPRFYVTVGPQSRAAQPSAPSPTWVVDAADEADARDMAESLYRLTNPDVGPVRLRVTRASPARR